MAENRTQDGNSDGEAKRAGSKSSGDRVVKGLRAVSDLSAAGVCDYYVIATKAAGVGAAAGMIAQVMAPDSIVITIQNGLGAAERIAGFKKPDMVEAAEELLAGTDWLPMPLRTPPLVEELDEPEFEIVDDGDLEPLAGNDDTEEEAVPLEAAE